MILSRLIFGAVSYSSRLFGSGFALRAATRQAPHSSPQRHSVALFEPNRIFSAIFRKLKSSSAVSARDILFSPSFSSVYTLRTTIRFAFSEFLFRFKRLFFWPATGLDCKPCLPRRSPAGAGRIREPLWTLRCPKPFNGRTPISAKIGRLRPLICGSGLFRLSDST
jgi:hypothetical protein